MKSKAASMGMGIALVGGMNANINKGETTMTLTMVYRDQQTGRKVIKISMGHLSTYTVQDQAGETMKGFKTKAAAVKLAKGEGFCNGLLFQSSST